MYDSAFGKRGVGRGGVSLTTTGPTKLLVSNLDFGVSNSDIQVFVWHTFEFIFTSLC